MSDVKVEHEVALTRPEAARWIADLAKALEGDGRVEIRLARSTVELEVPRHVRCEAELEIEGDEIELELELKWSIARDATTTRHPDGAGAAGSDAE